VTIRWGRRLQIVQHVVLRLARPFVRVLLAGIAVAGNNCLAGSVLLCLVSRWTWPTPAWQLAWPKAHQSATGCRPVRVCLVFRINFKLQKISETLK
jgi:hypothetical protein